MLQGNILVKSLMRQLQEKIEEIERLEAQIKQYETKIIEVFR